MSHSRQAVAEVRFSTRGAGLSSGPRLCPPCQPRGSLSVLCVWVSSALAQDRRASLLSHRVPGSASLVFR